MKQNDVTLAISSITTEVMHCNLMIEKHTHAVNDRACVNENYHIELITKYQKEVGILTAKLNVLKGSL